MANIKLTQEQIEGILKAYKEGETMLVLSKRYNVHINTIAKVVHKNGITRPVRGKGDYVRVSITIERELFKRIPHNRSRNFSAIISTLLEEWAEKNVPDLCPN